MLRQARASGATPVERPVFPRRHAVILIALALVTGLGLLAAPSSEGVADRKAIPVELPLAPPTEVVEPEPPPVTEKWLNVTVNPGDNLSVLFARAGLGDADVHHIVRKAPEAKSLTRLFPGEKLGFQLDDTGALTALKRSKSPIETIVYYREGDSYSRVVELREPEVHRVMSTATIESSLFLAGQKAGMSQNLIMELANVFGGVIDFVLDPRKGDTFHVVYEELYLDGERYKTGNILAATFVNKGQEYSAYRYSDVNGRAGYYDASGASMRRQFMLAPVDFTRISSHFNPRRLHPIYKTRRPHRGTDYAAPRGTPVFAAGEGRVTEAGYTKANGNYVVIQHGQAYTTKYLHLHKRKVRKGQRVAQNQVIGTVGSTGAATGPHLHYEFLVNGVHRNPRTIHKKLPKAASLAAAELPRFQQQTQSFQMQLASIRQQQLALNDSGSDAGP